MLTELVRQTVQTLGIKGASAGVLALLVAVALYSHKAASAGHRLSSAGSTATHDLKVVALVLAGLLVVGVISMDLQRAQEVVRQVAAFEWGLWVDRLRRLVT